MAYRIISNEGIFNQYTIMDFIGKQMFEIIDLRTPEGKSR